MAAKIKIYLDENCTKELIRNKNNEFIYHFVKYTPEGEKVTYLDGNKGETALTKLYFKNIGSKAALNVTLYNLGNTSVSVFKEESYFLGDIQVDDVVEVTIPLTCEAYTESKIDITRFYIDYYSVLDTAPEVNTSHERLSIAEYTDIDDIIKPHIITED